MLLHWGCIWPVCCTFLAIPRIALGVNAFGAPSAWATMVPPPRPWDKSFD